MKKFGGVLIAFIFFVLLIFNLVFENIQESNLEDPITFDEFCEISNDEYRLNGKYINDFGWNDILMDVAHTHENGYGKYDGKYLLIKCKKNDDKFYIYYLTIQEWRDKQAEIECSKMKYLPITYDEFCIKEGYTGMDKDRSVSQKMNTGRIETWTVNGQESGYEDDGNLIIACFNESNQIIKHFGIFEPVEGQKSYTTGRWNERENKMECVREYREFYDGCASFDNEKNCPVVDWFIKKDEEWNKE